MKANTPEKIYVSNYSSGLTYNWHNERLAVNDIEYTRTDAFIEKALGYIANNMRCNGYTLQTKVKFIKDFKKYMEN